ncbi:alpha/beta hydrolase [Candidatus Saccharibacteria bacterium]|nr:alpha/beta hydrolase [Candidatus Saccharibacteria bacterium]
MKQPNKKLFLAKMHDYCAVDEPKLTVVCIHGIASNSGTYNNALQYLEEAASLKAVRFVTFDLLGSGESLKDDTLEYDYNEQLEALHNSIEKLEIKTPLVLVGHSMGTFIVVRYANTYKDSVSQLILISPPVYTEENLQDPAFETAIKAFGNAVSAKEPKILQEKAFNNSLQNIVMDKSNYKNLLELKTPAVMIYGNADQLIGAFNYPKLLNDNRKYLSAMETEGGHSISRNKYTKMIGVLEGILHA